MNILEYLIPAAQAHEKWFIGSAEAQAYAVPEAYRSLNVMTGTLLVIIVTVLIAGYFLDRKYEQSDLYRKSSAFLRPLRGYATDVLAVSVGLTLVYSAWNGVLLADNYLLPATMVGTVLRGLEFTVGILLIVGLFAKESGVMLLLLYASLFTLVPWIEPVDYLYFFGIGIFLTVFPRGAYSLDSALGRSRTLQESTRRHAFNALRILTGIGVTALALGKFFNPGLHFALLDAFPDFNPYVIMQWMGIHLSRELYVFVLFGVEVTVGIVLTTGYFLRLTSIMLVPVFTGSILFLGISDIVGHLPLLGILFVFFAYGDLFGKRLPKKSDIKTRPE